MWNEKAALRNDNREVTHHQLLASPQPITAEQICCQWVWLFYLEEVFLA
jgi:hypothetical protein